MTSQPQRIAAVVYASLSVLAVVAAATAKGYVGSMGEFSFVVVVSALGLSLAHFWSATLAMRMSGPHRIDRRWLLHEAVASSVMLVPAVILQIVAGLALAVTGSFETAATVAMVGLLVALFAYTWVGATRRHMSMTAALLWTLATSAVGAAMVVVKVVA